MSITKGDGTMALVLALVFSALCAGATMLNVRENDKKTKEVIDCVTIGHMDPQTCKDALGL